MSDLMINEMGKPCIFLLNLFECVLAVVRNYYNKNYCVLDIAMAKSAHLKEVGEVFIFARSAYKTSGYYIGVYRDFGVWKKGSKV